MYICFNQGTEVNTAKYASNEIAAILKSKSEFWI